MHATIAATLESRIHRNRARRPDRNCWRDSALRPVYLSKGRGAVGQGRAAINGAWHADQSGRQVYPRPRPSGVVTCNAGAAPRTIEHQVELMNAFYHTNGFAAAETKAAFHKARLMIEQAGMRVLFLPLPHFQFGDLLQIEGHGESFSSNAIVYCSGERDQLVIIYIGWCGNGGSREPQQRRQRGCTRYDGDVQRDFDIAEHSPFRRVNAPARAERRSCFWYCVYGHGAPCYSGGRCVASWGSSLGVVLSCVQLESRVN